MRGRGSPRGGGRTCKDGAEGYRIQSSQRGGFKGGKGREGKER